MPTFYTLIDPLRENACSFESLGFVADTVNLCTRSALRGKIAVLVRELVLGF